MEQEVDEKIHAASIKDEGESKEETLEPKKKWRLLRYEELPDYMKDNEFVLKYYRAEWPLWRAATSLFSWHNETINVWTHLLGFVVFLCLTAVHLSYRQPEIADLLGQIPWWNVSAAAVENASANLGNFFTSAVTLIKLEPLMMIPVGRGETTAAAGGVTRWPFFVFLCGSMFCLLCSSMCHLLCCHSHRVNIFLNRLDYVGIAVMIVTSFFPPIYYVFLCQPHWQLIYLGTISAMGCATILSLLSPQHIEGKFRVYRALLFVGMGLSGVVPGAHAIAVNWNDPRRNLTLAYETAMAVSYLTGTVFYVTRVPERWKPGWFDLAGQSHQIFHVFVLAGALAHYGAALVFLQFRDESGCPTAN